jgi:Kef-type K+ transport system membrane component KefB
VEPVLFVVPALAVLAPLFARGVSRWIRIPIVVFELLLGILVGPSVLGWAGPSAFMSTLAALGLAMLFFLAGSEIEFGVFRGRTGRNAVLGWIVSIAAGLAIGWLFAPGDAAVIIGIALCSTALGTLLPILRDAGELRTPFGLAAGAVGAVGEFGPLIAVSVFLGSRDPGPSTLVLVLFGVIAAIAIWLSIALPHGAMYRFVSSSLHTSGQFAVRVVFFVLTALLALSIALDLDMLLGAFTAGVVWRLLMRDAREADREAVESKVEAVAFGFLVPVFFLYTGLTFDLSALLAQPILFAFVPVTVLALLLVRGVPSMLAAPAGSSWRDRVALGLLGATGLPIIVAATAIGVASGVLSSSIASVLVAGGMLSVLLLPLIAMKIRGSKPASSETVPSESSLA